MPIPMVRESDGVVFAQRFAKSEIPVGREGSFKEAPAEFRFNDGSDFWFVTPFKPEPWAFARKPTPPSYPLGFELIFGAPPAFDEGEETRDEWTHDRVDFESKLRTFVRVGYPVTDELPVNVRTGKAYDIGAIDLAEVEYGRFGFGKPVYFLQQDAEYGERWMARFPHMREAYKPAFGVNGKDHWASETIEQADIVIAQGQARILGSGIELEDERIGILLEQRDEDEETAS